MGSDRRAVDDDSVTICATGEAEHLISLSHPSDERALANVLGPTPSHGKCHEARNGPIGRADGNDSIGLRAPNFDNAIFSTKKLDIKGERLNDVAAGELIERTNEVVR